MEKILAVLAVAVFAGVLSEAPIGGNYLPPGHSSFGNPDGTGSLARNIAAPDNQYGVPSTSGFGAGSGISRFSSSPPSNFRSFTTASGQIKSNPSYEYTVNIEYGSGAQGKSRGASASSRYSSPSSGFNSGSDFESGSASPITQYGTPDFFGESGGSGEPGRLSDTSSAYDTPGGGLSRNDGSSSAPLGDSSSGSDSYEFAYQIQDDASGSTFGHLENGQFWDAIGEYRVILPDGRTQIVEYEADDEGYKPNIRYEVTAEGIAAARKAEAIRQAVQKAALRAEKIIKANERLSRLNKPSYGPY